MANQTLLFELQTIDSEILEKKKLLTDVLAQMKESAEIQAAKEKSAETDSFLKKQQAIYKNAELKLNGLQAKLKSSSDRLYSGKVSGSRELLDLQNEVDSLTRRVSKLEEDTLEAELEVEDAQETHDKAANQVKALAEKRAEKLVSLDAEKRTLALRLNKLLGERKQQVGRIDPKLFNSYEQTRKKMRGLAVVKLRIDTCTGCHTTVSATMVKRVQEGEIVRCSLCSRILVRA